jgi:hypothetical protein
MVTRTEPTVSVTIAGGDLGWLLSLSQTVQGAYAVTVVHTSHPLRELGPVRGYEPGCAIVALSSHDSAMEVRDLLDRLPRVRFVFVAQALPLRPAVARVIRERGHAAIGRRESPLVIAATASMLMAALTTE